MDELERFIEEYSGEEYDQLGILKKKKGEIAKLIRENCVVKVKDNYDTYYRDEGEYGICMNFSAELLDKITQEKVGTLGGIAETDKQAIGGYSNGYLCYKDKSMGETYTRISQGSAPYWAIMEIAAQIGVEQPSKEKWLITKSK